jgi:hypothetical protein
LETLGTYNGYNPWMILKMCILFPQVISTFSFSMRGGLSNWLDGISIMNAPLH